MSTDQQRYQHIKVILNSTDYNSQTAPLAQEGSLILRSWQRCLTQHKLDPSSPRPARIVTQQILREHQDSAEEFLSVARAGVEQLYSHIAELGYVLLLSDHRGITVQYLGNKNHDSCLQQAGLYLGADWSEKYAGTCAIGTCIQELQALTCHRIEHFYSSHIQLSCTAAPIFDASGALLAVLNISALNSAISPASQNFALHLTQLYAKIIENAYFLKCYHQHLIFKADFSRELVQTNGQLLFALDDNGFIIAANTAARSLLQKQENTPSQLTISLPHLLECKWPDILAINYERKDGVKAFSTQLSKNTLFGTLIEPSGKTNGTQHYILNKEESVPQLDALGADDPKMQRTLSLSKKLRNRDINLLIQGETGSGKEVLAQAIHYSSERLNKPFIAVNCAALPESLIESELFGYLPGTFTGGRTKGAKGLIQEASGGTLFLDEIGDMPLALQTRLLRVLAEKQVLPLGATTPIPVNLRVIAATHCDLQQRIELGQFRADLYYRLNGANLNLPSFRERADKDYIIQHILKSINSSRRSRPITLRGDAMSAILAYNWPGNIRQLVNALTFAEATCEQDEITVYDLPEECSVSTLKAPPLVTQKIDLAIYNKHRPSEKSQKEQLLHLLKIHKWNISAVARELDISRPTLYRWLNKHDLQS